MKRLCALVLVTLVVATPSARAQNAPAPEAPPASPANVRFDVVITDDVGGAKVLSKTVTLNVIASSNQVDSGIGQIRSSARPAGVSQFTATGSDGKTMIDNNLNLNVDINRPRLMQGNKIRVPIVVEYRNCGVTGELELPDDWRVALDDPLLTGLSEWLPPESVRVVY